MSDYAKECCCKFETLKKICIAIIFILVISTLAVLFFLTNIFDTIIKQNGYTFMAVHDESSASLQDIERNSLQNKAISLQETEKRLEEEKKLKLIKKNLFEEFQCTEEEAATKKIILFWTVPWGDTAMPMEYGLGYMKRSKNGYVINTDICGSCLVVFDKKFFLASDAVLFHGQQINSEAIPPEKSRKPNQVYVWWNQESIAVYTTIKKHYLNFFNYSMTVRRNSDVPSPYGTFPGILKMVWSKEHGNDVMENFARVSKYLSQDAESRASSFLNKNTKSTAAPFDISSLKGMPKQLEDLMQSKIRLVAWVVSNCDWMQGSRMRMKLFHSLTKAGLTVDQFGKCSGVRIPLSRWEPEFFNFMSRYKFYFAWENSIHCHDYMTEKVWLTSLYSGAVPIVFGPHRDDIAAVLPPKSYIFVEDFANAHKLVEYLHYLDRNATAYAEYLEWRTWVKYLDENGNFQADKLPHDSDETKLIKKFLSNKTEMQSNASFCELCRQLNYEKIENKVVDDMKKWSLNDRPECLNTGLAKLDYLFDS